MHGLQTVFCAPTFKHKRRSAAFLHLPWCCSDALTFLVCLVSSVSLLCHIIILHRLAARSTVVLVLQMFNCPPVLSLAHRFVSGSDRSCPWLLLIPALLFPEKMFAISFLLSTSLSDCAECLLREQ